MRDQTLGLHRVRKITCGIDADFFAEFAKHRLPLPVRARIKAQKKRSMRPIERLLRLPVNKHEHCREMNRNVTLAFERAAEEFIDNFRRMVARDLIERLRKPAVELRGPQCFD